MTFRGSLCWVHLVEAGKDPTLRVILHEVGLSVWMMRWRPTSLPNATRSGSNRWLRVEICSVSSGLLGGRGRGVCRDRAEGAALRRADLGGAAGPQVLVLIYNLKMS